MRYAITNSSVIANTASNPGVSGGPGVGVVLVGVGIGFTLTGSFTFLDSAVDLSPPK